jgi:hypothetical protein
MHALSFQVRQLYGNLTDVLCALRGVFAKYNQIRQFADFDRALSIFFE